MFLRGTRREAEDRYALLFTKRLNQLPFLLTCHLHTQRCVQGGQIVQVSRQPNNIVTAGNTMLK